MVVGGSEADWRHVERVTRPALLLALTDFLADVAARLDEAGVQAAVARRDTAPIFDWLMTLVALQGVSDVVAFDFDARHGGVTFAAIEAALRPPPSCARLSCYWAFAGCGYRKGVGTCADPAHQPACPLPRHDLRKGALNRAAYALFLFVRDVCDGDLVGFIDDRLAVADPGVDAPDRTARLRHALLEPLGHVHGISNKLWAMMLAELLMAGDPGRERWVTTGASMGSVDTLVHNFLHRTGVLSRFGAEHHYGARCYQHGGCAAIIEGLAARVDARAFNPAFPRTFPRWVQHAVWRFCSTGVLNVCNGTRIDDRGRCRQALTCPAYVACDRVALSRRGRPRQVARP